MFSFAFLLAGVVAYVIFAQPCARGHASTTICSTTEVEDRVVQVTDAVAVVADPPVLYLRLDGGTADGPETIVLVGDYLTRLRRTGCFPSTTLRLIQLPRSRAVVGILPMGEVLPLAYVSGTDHRPVEFDGQPTATDFERLRARASW